MIYSTVILNKMYSTQTCIYLRNALFRWHWEQLSWRWCKKPEVNNTTTGFLRLTQKLGYTKTTITLKKILTQKIIAQLSRDSPWMLAELTQSNQCQHRRTCTPHRNDLDQVHCCHTYDS